MAKRTGTVSALLIMLAMALPAQAGGCEATGFVTNAGKAFMAAANRKSPAAFSGAAARYADLNSIALFALGPYRKDLPAAQRAEYLALARGYMGRFLAKYSSRLNGTGLTVTDCKGSSNSLLVNTRFSGGQKVIFRLAKGKGGYRVQDVNVSSVWLAQLMRTKFTGILRKNGGEMSALFRFLKG